MRKLYGSTNWRRVLALVLVFVMMFSVMGTSGYSVFAEGPEETGETVVESTAEEPAQEDEFTPQGESPGSETVVETEGGEEDVVIESAEESDDEGEPEAPVDTVEATDEDSEEPAASVEDEEADDELNEDADLVEAEDEEDEASDEETDLEEETEEDTDLEANSEEKMTLVETGLDIALNGTNPEVADPEGTTEFDPVMFDDAIVTISAEPYTFPEDTTVTVEEVILGRTQMDAITKAVKDEFVTIKAYDITFFANGKEIQPTKPIKINIESVELTALENPQVVHIEDNNRNASVLDNVDLTESGVEFDAEHFSIYVVIEGEDQKVYHRTYKFEDINDNGAYTSYEFYNKAGNLVDQQILKSGDELESVGTPYHTGYDFIGWYLWDADANDFGTAVSFETAISMDLSADEAVTVRARYGGVYYIHFHENPYDSTEDVILTTCVVPAEDSYPINNIKAPIPSAGTIFIGWRLSDNETLLDSPYTPTSDANLYPVFTPGYWLRFDGNGTGASYTEAISVSTVTDLNTVTKPDNPTRPGYVFAGWFTTADGNEEFEWSGKLSADKVIYAHWTPQTVSYSVFYWLENADDDDYTFLTSKALEGTAGANTAATALTVNEQNQFSNINWNGFLYQDAEQTVIKGDGSTVVNVFYDRKIVTLTFHRQSNTTYTQDNNGDYYKVTRQGGYNNITYYYKSGPGDSDYTNINTAIGDNTYFLYRSEGPLAYISGDTIPLYREYQRWVDGYWEGWTYHWGYFESYYALADGVTGRITRYSISGLSAIVISEKYGKDIHAQWPDNPQGTKAWYLSNNPNDRTYVTMITTMPVSNTDYYYRSASGNNVFAIDFKTQNLDDLNSFTSYTIGSSRGSESPVTTADDYSGILGFSLNAASNQDAQTIRGTNGGDPNAKYDNRYPTSPAIRTSFSSGIHTGNTYTLTFYYLRNQYDIEFISNGQVVKSEEGIYYGADITGKAPAEYVVDEKEAVINGENCVFKGWYDNAEGDGKPYTFDTMPAGNLTLYAKWEKAWYIITIDPNGGVLNGGDPSVSAQATWFWEAFGNTVIKYDTTRNYVADPEGTYYYHKSIHPGENDYDRLAYYTTDSTLSTDGGKTYKQEEGVYVFEGWYRLDKNGNPESDPYDFEEPIRGAFTLQAQWRKTGAYTVAYQGFDGSVGGNMGYDETAYADGAVITVSAGPSSITAMYVFDGWELVDATGAAIDNSGKLYQPGDELKLNAEWADSSKVIHLQARYTNVTESEDPIGITKLVLNANGGLADPDKDYKITDANGHVATPSVVDGVVTYSNLPINQTYKLSKVNGFFTREGYVFKGWNTSKNEADAGTVLYDNTYTIGMDNDDPDANTLYAVWEKVQTYTVIFMHNTNGGVEIGEPEDFVVNDITPVIGEQDQAVTYADIPAENTFDLSEVADLFTNTGYKLLGWNTLQPAADNGVIEYQLTDTIDPADFKTDTIRLYGVWAMEVRVVLTGSHDEAEYDGEEHTNAAYSYTVTIAGVVNELPQAGLGFKLTGKDQNNNNVADLTARGTEAGTYTVTLDVALSNTETAEQGNPNKYYFPEDAVTRDKTYNGVITLVITEPPVPDTYTVEYKKGDHGAFAENATGQTTFANLTAGEDTPAYNGALDDYQKPLGEEKYTFVGWDPEVKPTVLAEDCTEGSFVITYTAQWAVDNNENGIPDVDELFYDANGGEGEMDATKGNEEGIAVVAANTFTREGYDFTEWNTKADGSGDAYAAGASFNLTDEIDTVYAQWTAKEEPAKTYTIIYHSNYTSKVASETDEDIAVEDVTVIVTFNDVKGANEQKFTKTSPWTNGNTTYTFNSWNTKADGSGTKFTPGAYDGTGAVVEDAQQPVAGDGTASAVSTSARTLRAMIATTSNGGTLELWAQWDETTSGGGNPRPPKDPDPTDEPEEPIDDPDTPLAPAEEDPIEDEDTEIDDGDTPYAGYEEEPDESIDEEPTPFSPYTGDDRHTAAWGFVSLLSLAGIAVVARRRREEE